MYGRLAPFVDAVEPEEPVRWDFHDLADQLGETLQTAEDALRLEQAVYGIDSLDELRLHQLLVRGMSRWWTVQREVYYPSSSSKRKSGRARCDMVFTPRGRMLRPSEGDDLFSLVEGNTVDAEQALWLEVKSAYQFRDVATRHTGYAGQWKTGTVDDLKKMEAEPRIREGGVLLVVFNESEEILAKDLELFEEHLAQKGVKAGIGHVRSIRISDRMGHRFASVALWPTVTR